MKMMALSLWAGIILLAGCSHSRPDTVPPPEAAAMRQTLLQAMESSAAAWNRADLDGHVALYTDSAAMMGKNGPIIGKGRIRSILERGFWSDGRPAQQLSFRDLVVTPLGPGHAMVTGQCMLTGGGKADYFCRFTTIWEKRPDGWRIIHDHSS